MFSAVYKRDYPKMSCTQGLEQLLQITLKGEDHFSLLLRSVHLTVCLAVLIQKILLSMCLNIFSLFQFGLLANIWSSNFLQHWNVFRNTHRTISHCSLDQLSLSPIQHCRLLCWHCLVGTPACPLNTLTQEAAVKKLTAQKQSQHMCFLLQFSELGMN